MPFFHSYIPTVACAFAPYSEQAARAAAVMVALDTIGLPVEMQGRILMAMVYASGGDYDGAVLEILGKRPSESLDAVLNIRPMHYIQGLFTAEELEDVSVQNFAAQLSETIEHYGGSLNVDRMREIIDGARNQGSVGEELWKQIAPYAPSTPGSRV